MADTRIVHVVDDKESVRKSIGFLLKASGYTVRPWASGPDFLDGASREEIGCVLLDVRMPEMDGLEVQEEMAARGIAMPVIILTGHGDVSTAMQAMKIGAVEFIEKPFDRDVLLAAVAKAFGQLDHSVSPE